MRNYNIHLIRSGSASSGEGRRYLGQQDVSLCGQGREELRRLRDTYDYPPVDLVFSSPLSRCTETAGILYPDAEIIAVEDLMDISLGAFEGGTFEELRNDPDFSRWISNSYENPPPGGEDPVGFANRTVQALNQVLRQMMSEGVHEAAVITHGGVIMSLLGAVGLPQLPLHQWATAAGTGYTVLASAQMWMRDGAVEVAGVVPAAREPEEYDEDRDGERE